MFWLSILLFAVFLLILTLSIFNLYRQKEIQRAKAIIVNCVFYSILFVCILLFKIEVPYWALLLTMAAVFISGYCGEYLRVYYRSRVFDRYLHAYGAFVFALLFYYLLQHFFGATGTPLFLAIFVFLLGNTLGVIFELMEFSHDVKPTATSKEQHGLKDTDTDMLFNLIGSAGAAVFIYFSVS